MEAQSEYQAKTYGFAEEDIIKTAIFGQGNPSRQIRDDPFSDLYQGGDVVEPLYDPSFWGFLLELSPRLHRLVNLMAQNTVAIGWQLVPITGIDAAALQSAIAEETARISAVLNRPNPSIPLNWVLKLTKLDEEATGNGYLEVSRLPAAMKSSSLDVAPVNGIFHAPAHTMRVLRNGGFIQIRKNRRRYFKEFGDLRIIDVDTGKEAGDSLPNDRRANEIIHFKIHCVRSSYYGAPRYVSCAPGISGNRYNSLRNLNFFQNDGTPRLIILVNDGTLDSQSETGIRNFMQHQTKGVENASRVLLLQRNKKNAPSNSKNKPIEVIPLTVGVTDDASFLKYQDFNNEELRETFGIGKIFMGTSDDVNRASAVVSRKTTIDQIFVPEQILWEYQINATIIDSFAPQYVQWQLLRPSAMDAIDNSDIVEKYGRLGSFSFDDLRQEAGKQAYDKSWSKLPIPVVLKLIEKLNSTQADPASAQSSSPADILNNLDSFLESIVAEDADAIMKLKGLARERINDQVSAIRFL
jgi:capsid portal protein